MQWETFKRSLVPFKEEKATVACPKCSSTWLETVECNEYDANHQVVLGQKVPAKTPNASPYILLRCVRCTNLLEPIILYSTRDIGANNPYDKFLDVMEGKHDSRPKVDLETELKQVKEELAVLKEALSKLVKE